MVKFIQFKVDDSVANDQKSRRGEHNENAVVNKVRNHCKETLGTERDLCLVTTKQLNKFDGDILVQKLIDAIQGKKSDGKFNILNNLKQLFLRSHCPGHHAHLSGGDPTQA